MITLENEEQRSILLDAIDLKLASCKRAINSTKDPYRALHQEEYDAFAAFRVEVIKAPVNPELIKKQPTK